MKLKQNNPTLAGVLISHGVRSTQLTFNEFVKCCLLQDYVAC